MQLFPETRPADGTVVFDIETQHSFDEVGGRTPEHMAKLQLSLAVLYRYSDDKYITYLEKDAPQLIEELHRASFIVGFNLLGFDYLVMSRYGKLDPNIATKTVDMMYHCEKELGKRPSLNSLAQATLGEGKSADGLEAIRWFREGKMKELEMYCRQDVEVTRKIYEFGKERGFVHFVRNGAKIKVPATW